MGEGTWTPREEGISLGQGRGGDGKDWDSGSKSIMGRESREEVEAQAKRKGRGKEGARRGERDHAVERAEERN